MHRAFAAYAPATAGLLHAKAMRRKYVSQKRHTLKGNRQGLISLMHSENGHALCLPQHHSEEGDSVLTVDVF